VTYEAPFFVFLIMIGVAIVLVAFAAVLLVALIIWDWLRRSLW